MTHPLLKKSAAWLLQWQTIWKLCEIKLSKQCHSKPVLISTTTNYYLPPCWSGMMDFWSYTTPGLSIGCSLQFSHQFGPGWCWNMVLGFENINRAFWLLSSFSSFVPYSFWYNLWYDGVFFFSFFKRKFRCIYKNLWFDSRDFLNKNWEF